MKNENYKKLNQTNSVRVHVTERSDYSIKTKYHLLILMTVPTVMFLVLLALVFLPQLLANPKYDFIFTKCKFADYMCDLKYYGVDSNGKIVSSKSIGRSSKSVFKMNPMLNGLGMIGGDTDLGGENQQSNLYGNDFDIFEDNSDFHYDSLSSSYDGYHNRYSRSNIPKLYRYDVKSDQITEIDPEDNINVNSKSKSPDGYKIKQSENSGGFLYYIYNWRDAYYLKKGLVNKRLDLSNGKDKENSYIRDNYKILGWVKR